MKKFVCAVLAACLLAQPVRADDPGVVVNTVPDTQGMQVGADAAVVMEVKTGRVLFAQDADEQLPVASTTKIMTALIALEQYDVDAVFEVDAAAIQVEGSSMGLQEGDQASLRALAVGMLLSSGNDAANAAAVRVAGSIDAFADMMNERARAIGMENTHFATPSGLDADDHYSTAHDMALLARVALQNQDFAAICSEYKLRTQYGNPPYDRWLTNHNKLLNYYENTIGIKTGFTRKAGRCLVSAAEQDGVELIVVTLNCPDDWNVHESLYERHFDELTLEDLSAYLPALTVPVTGGTLPDTAAARMDAAQVPVLEGDDITYTITVQPFLYAPVNQGQPVGTARIYLNGTLVSTLELIAGGDVPLLHEYEEKQGFLDWLFGLFH